ncbi:MAG: hypothetical protein WCG06_06770 [Candidatus Omnitrophota bacterium]
MIKRQIKSGVSVAALQIIFLLVVSAVAWADVAQMKLYKEAFPEEKPKCSSCHVAAMPKKADGEHQLNAYGTKVKAIKATLDVEAYKTAGKIQ